MDQQRTWRNGVRSPGDVLLVLMLLAGAWAGAYLAGGTHTVAPHLFYVPVLFAAAHRDLPATVVTALTAGVLCGPLMPLVVATGESQPAANWVPRTIAFLAIGTTVAVLLGRIDKAASAAAEAAEAAGRAEAETELRLARQRERMLELVNHELRTPLTVVRGSSELLKRHATGNDQLQHQLLDAIVRASRRLESLSTVLDAAVDQDGHVQTSTVSLRAVIDAAIGELPARSGTDADARIHLQGALDTTLATSPVHLRTALGCILDNALRFSPPDEPVTVRVQVVPAEDGDEDVVITIRDRGEGLPPDVDQLFEAFEQGDETLTRRYQGLGLGLYATARLTAQLGGSVELADAADGPGTIARLHVPRSPGDLRAPTHDRDPVAAK